MEFSLNNIFQSLVPKDKRFIPLFIESSANTVRCAEKLNELMRSDSVTRINAYREIERLENQGDEITHVIMREAATTFIVPFDREDIQELAVIMDDIADYINGVSKMMELYKIHQIPPSMPKMAEIILKAVKELDVIVNNLKSLRYSKSMQHSLQVIRDCEKEVEEIYNDAIAKLFKDSNAIEILKLKEVFSFLTATTDKVEETASVIESVLVKFS